MSKLLNVYADADGTFYYLITIRAKRFIEAGFQTAEEAAWQCDRAKWFLNCHELMGRKTAYNYPERIQSVGESEWSVPIPGLWEFIEQCKGAGEVCPILSIDDAERMEQARAIAEGQLERDREVEEAKRRIVEDRRVKDTSVARETLQTIISSLRHAIEQFDSLHIPKSTKPANALHAALRAMGAELASLK
jgi:hypothetical protein